MKKNKYKFKKCVLIPIFLLTCSLVLGFCLVKPVNAIQLGFNGNSGISKDWYSLMPNELVLDDQSNGTSIFVPFDTYYPSDFELTSQLVPVLYNQYRYGVTSNPSDQFQFLSNVFLDSKNVTLNSFNYNYYDNLVSVEGYGATDEGYPLSFELKYNDLILPYGYTGSELSPFGYSRPIRTEHQLEMINSDFFTNMAVYLYKPVGVSNYNIHFNNVLVEYAVMKPESWQGGVNDSVNGISNVIEYNSYNWSYSNDNNNYLNPYDNTLYPILTEDDQYIKIDLYNLLRMIIDTEEENNFSNGKYVGKYLVYFPLISVNGFSDALTLTSNRVFAVTGSSTPHITGSSGNFYNDDNIPFSSLYINSLDYMSYYNYVVPNIVIPKPTDMTSWLVTSVGAFVNAEIFPGFAIGGILAVLIALPLAIWLIKIILGG